MVELDWFGHDIGEPGFFCEKDVCTETAPIVKKISWYQKVDSCNVLLDAEEGVHKMGVWIFQRYDSHKYLGL